MAQNMVAQVRHDAEAALEHATTADELEQFRVKYLGRKGAIQDLKKQIKSVEPDNRAAFGKAVNDLARDIEEKFELKQNTLGSAPAKPTGKQYDVTLPGIRPRLGRPHILRQTMRQLAEIFGRMGFEVIDAPEIEDEYHNFVALNIPAEHPARDPLDNFYLADRDDTLLRSQTSTAQIRIMEQRTPPVRVVHYGRCYRPDTIDATHHMMFHQIEALYVDEGVSMVHLKSTILQFCRALLGSDVEIRLRPSYFPFTEPSAEVDIRWNPGGKGWRWMELGGCGMVDPNVLEMVGYDSERYTGFAFGFGIERLTMPRHQITDIRHFFDNDVRFLQQF